LKISLGPRSCYQFPLSGGDIPPAWLKLAHAKLDAAVLAAYGLAEGTSNDDLLARLLAINFERKPVGVVAVPLVNESANDSTESQ
jgi:hypothetical protein